ncbi:hypothetical protein EBR43_05150 [bacterium]|nr:hypothetical protein [bacterium]NBW57166.1 hypothetical protein [bacterium]NBX71738.1 hypothetical protein [bacterium]
MLKQIIYALSYAAHAFINWINTSVQNIKTFFTNLFSLFFKSTVSTHYDHQNGCTDSDHEDPDYIHEVASEEGINNDKHQPHQHSDQHRDLLTHSQTAKQHTNCADAHCHPENDFFYNSMYCMPIGSNPKSQNLKKKRLNK